MYCILLYTYRYAPHSTCIYTRRKSREISFLPRTNPKTNTNAHNTTKSNSSLSRACTDIKILCTHIPIGTCVRASVSHALRETNNFTYKRCVEAVNTRKKTPTRPESLYQYYYTCACTAQIHARFFFRFFMHRIPRVFRVTPYSRTALAGVHVKGDAKGLILLCLR